MGYLHVHLDILYKINVPLHTQTYIHTHIEITQLLTKIIILLTETLNKTPTLRELVRLKYTEKGEEKKLQLIKEASHKWKNIASIISDDANKTRVLEQQHPGDPYECLRQTLIDDFIDNKPEDYSQDWKGLIELLDDVDLKTLADKIKNALSCMQQ